MKASAPRRKPNIPKHLLLHDMIGLNKMEKVRDDLSCLEVAIMDLFMWFSNWVWQREKKIYA
jgi:hypothetical protein